jgi:hypothetical protein
MIEDEIARFERDVLKGQRAPDDLRVLLKLQLERVPNDEYYSDPLEELGCKILMPGEIHSLLSHDYLNDEDRANPNIMSNVVAIDAVIARCSFVAVTDDSDVVGYWHGPQALTIERAPIVKFDTEGQFSLLHGRHLTEALVGDRVFDDDEAFAEFRDGFAAHGIAFHAGRWDDLAEPDASSKPDEMHSRLYNEERVRRGLEPVD